MSKGGFEDFSKKKKRVSPDSKSFIEGAKEGGEIQLSLEENAAENKILRKKLTVKVDETTYKSIRLFAAHHNQTHQDICAQAIKEFLENHS